MSPPTEDVPASWTSWRTRSDFGSISAAAAAVMPRGFTQMMARTAMRETSCPNLQFAPHVSIHESIGMNIFMGLYLYKTYLQIKDIMNETYFLKSVKNRTD